MDKPTRNLIQKATQDARRLLESEFSEQLEGIFDILPNGRIEPEPGEHLNPRERIVREKIVAAIEHEKAGGMSAAEAVAGYLREASYTCLNRFAALKMMEGQGLLQECVSNGEQSSGFREFCGLAPGLAELPDKGYRLYIESLFDELSAEIRVLFDRRDTASLLWPRRKAFEGLLDILNREELAGIWGEDETIGWVYQYFNPPEERKAMREASQAPRNSRELAVRNQFFTPRYVVEFLTDNTLGRIWYEMTQGKTGMKDFCRYLVRRPVEIFLKPGEASPLQAASDENLSQEELLKQPVHIPHRPMKDPRTIRMLDPACGSMHFGLYSFDLFERIYEEAWELELQLGAPAFVREAGLKPLTETYPDKEAFLRDMPRLIIEHNIHGIDIDPRAVQIAGLSLWLRAQRSWHNQGVKPADRPRINRSNIVCAEPMPGEEDMRREFTAGLKPRVLGQIVDEVFEKMKIAGEAGSLLKIEEEIKDSVAAAKIQWEEQPKPVQMELFGGLIPAKPVQMELRFDVKGITDERFWEQTEDRILDALKDYAERAENGHSVRRKLFSEDAAHGFAFIDACRKRYDVVLMNPPFGSNSRAAKGYLAEVFHNSANDILGAFVERFLARLVETGRFGAITSRTAFFISSFAEWRREILRKQSQLVCFADLGGGVMDGATVEAAAYILERSKVGKKSEKRVPFLRMLTQDDKQFQLSRSIELIREGLQDKQYIFWAGFSQFVLLPDSPFVYWIQPGTIVKLSKWPRFEPTIGKVRKGLRTGDNFRFVRALWEIPLSEYTPKILSSYTELQRKVSKWVPLVLSGSSQPWFAPFLVVLNWKNNGEELRQYVTKYGSPSRLIQAEDFYFKAGMSWTLRAPRFVPYAIPAGCIPTGSRPMAFLKKGREFGSLAVSASQVASAFMRFYGDWFTRPKFLEGKLKLVPWPDIDKDLEPALKALVLSEIEDRRRAYQGHEPFHEFVANFAFSNECSNTAVSIDWHSLLGADLETKILKSFGLDMDEAVELYRDLQEALTVRRVLPNLHEEDGDEDENAELILDISEKSRFESIFSYSIGLAIARWDIRIALKPSLAAKISEPFDPLPVCPPGMLVNPEGLPAEPEHIVSKEWLRARPDANTLPPDGSVHNPTIPDSEYPIRISWDGILVDDPGFNDDQLHNEDIIRRTREVLTVLWQAKAQDIEQEACDILNIPDLRTYFRKNFFSDHIKRYSKSRRKAPIYWQLSTPSASYSVWLYYHRFTKDIFYKIINEFVTPKLQFEERELTSARQQYGTNPTANQRKEIAARETFVGELKTFKEEVARIAPLWNPNLNDGVIINFAPLWRLVPQNRSWQKECKTIWDKLVSGDYDWAHLAMHLWPERVVPKCTTDRSLAIAHGLDEALWEEDEKAKWHAKEISKETLNALIQERTSATVKAALEELLNASVANGAGPRKTMRKS